MGLFRMKKTVLAFAVSFMLVLSSYAQNELNGCFLILLAPDHSRFRIRGILNLLSNFSLAFGFFDVAHVLVRLT
jgi:hypothetical protein